MKTIGRYVNLLNFYIGTIGIIFLTVGRFFLDIDQEWSKGLVRPEPTTIIRGRANGRGGDKGSEVWGRLFWVSIVK